MKSDQKKSLNILNVYSILLYTIQYNIEVQVLAC